MPEDRKHLLPTPYRELMTGDEGMPLARFFPRKVLMDREIGKRPWEAITLLPFIDIELLLEAVAKHVDKSRLSAEEQKRNCFGGTSVYTFQAAAKDAVVPVLRSTLPGYVPDVAKPQTKCTFIPFAVEASKQT
eukprot:TRINITY_DN19782_c0_g1_i1.p2 TRINITY_DN19782_c0_g1~~TRINITY_DN19782_c0_g1_i1.p2  ORF type:complete len:133 (-),score=27.30 TRINITY_DN19782_c0_g1_i1:74-472(-)